LGVLVVLGLTVTLGEGMGRIGAAPVGIGAVMFGAGVPGFALDVDDAKYFWFHHSDGDTMAVIDPQEFRRCIGAMAVLAYTLADLPQAVPR